MKKQTENNTKRNIMFNVISQGKEELRDGYPVQGLQVKVRGLQEVYVYLFRESVNKENLKKKQRFKIRKRELCTKELVLVVTCKKL